MKAVQIILVSLPLIGCSEATSLYKKYKKWTEDPTYEPPAGEDATIHLVESTGQYNLNDKAMLEAIDSVVEDQGQANLISLGLLNEDEADKVAEVSPDAADFLKSGNTLKVKYNADDFIEIDDSFFDKAPPESGDEVSLHLIDESVAWTHSENEFLVSTVNKIPVKNQGRRGTCASFAGIGQIEAYLIKQYNLSGIDLSEQRFYFMSKPENWDNGGGDPSKGGSNAGTGFSKSFGTPYKQESAFAPGSDQEFNIPLEIDCPYNKEKGSNDVQSPQPSGCLKGVAKVTDYNAWVYQWDARPNTPQELYDILVNEDLPVIVASKLSDMWEKNDGIITLAGSGDPGDSSHAGGHAYLLVGVRKLNEAEYPNEGGMCFIVKNSWGKGWGINGFSCMTLAYFNQWRFTGGFPRIKSVSINTDRITEAENDAQSKPDGLTEPDNETKKNSLQKRGKKRGSVSFLRGLNLQSGDMKVGLILADNDRFYKVLYYLEDDLLVLRGLLSDLSTQTHNLELERRDNDLYFSFPYKGTTKVGSLDLEQNRMILCSQKYNGVCHLNYASETNELVIGLTQEEFDRDESKGPYNWVDFGWGSETIQLSHPPGWSSRIDVRYRIGDLVTNPLRFHIGLPGGDIKYHGKIVGNIYQVALCSGDYRKICRIIRSDTQYQLIFRSGAS